MSNFLFLLKLQKMVKQNVAKNVTISLGETTLRIMTFSIKDTQHNDIQHKRHSA
jgi:hypothetical protein